MKSLKNLTESQVQALAQRLASENSDKDLVVGLVGPLGAGKTTFAKSFALALGIKKIKSPTFIVAAEYQLKHKKFYHLDLYRLNQRDQLAAIGLADILESQNRTVLIEWVDKFPHIKKQCDLIVKLTVAPNHKRHVTITNN